MPAGGTCRTRKPVDGPSAAMPPVRRTRHTQSRRASEARPSARCTAPPSRTAPQTPEARPSDPPRPIGHATVGRDDEQEHSENLCYLDRDIGDYMIEAARNVFPSCPAEPSSPCRLNNVTPAKAG